MSDDLMIFTGNANPELAKKVASHLSIDIGKATVDRFSDGEVMIELLENVRGREVFVIQSTCQPCNDSLMELLIMADALKRASADSITAVIPYFGYARQDRRIRSARVPITAKIVADMISSVGFNRLVTVDLHADQIQGFFSCPVDNVYATPIIMEDIRAKKFDAPVIVSPDIGGVVRARATAKRLGDSDLAIIDKRRPNPNEAKVMNIIGDIQNRHCILIDDIIDTAGTLCQAADGLKERGAATITAYCTHPVLSGTAVERINKSQITEVVVTNTIPLSAQAQQSSKIRQLDLSPMLAETLHRINEDESVSAMFID